jgi:exopolysaccharide production protein ExoQ
MPPQLVLLFAYILVFWLMRRDTKERKAGSWALLIPGLWIAIQGSRSPSYWLNPGGPDEGVDNPIDTIVSIGLIFCAFITVQRRGLDWGRLIGWNKALFLIYAYFALSAIWSDLPLLSVKRIAKDFGLVIMALVFLTEQNPALAIRAVFVRVSYILFPLSMVMIKWFPQIGRQARNSGDSMFRGLTPHKNTLGQVVFVFGLMLLWDLLEIRREPASPQRKSQIYVRVVMLLMGAWLMVTCDSQTSLLCIIVGVLVFWMARLLQRMPNGKNILICSLAVAACLGAAEKTFGISDMVIRALGRNPSLTGRTDIWRVVKEQKTDPIVGNGFYVFWDTPKGKTVVHELAQIKSTHNGYLEVYVDGGFTGDALLVLFLLALGRRVIDRLFLGNPLGILGLVFWVLAIIYNFSESSFFRLDSLWFVLLLMTIDCPGLWYQTAEDTNCGENESVSAAETETAEVQQVKLNQGEGKFCPPAANSGSLQNARAGIRRCMIYDRVRWLAGRILSTGFGVTTVSNSLQNCVVSRFGTVSFFGGLVGLFRRSSRNDAASQRPLLRRFDWWSSDKVFPSLALA